VGLLSVYKQAAAGGIKELTSIPLNTFPSHSFLHLLAAAPSRNFINIKYLFILPVITILKWLTSCLVFSPTHPKKSLAVI
jgi:hypothetical protein